MTSILLTHFDCTRLEHLLDHIHARGDVDLSIQALEDELAHARVVDESQLPANVVTMNSEVHIIDLDTREELCLRVVFPELADVESGRVSVLAPIGLAVLGSREGDVLEWPMPRHVRRIRIERVIYQPEAAGDRL